MTHTIKLSSEEFRALQRADYEMSGMQVLMKELVGDGFVASEAVTTALIQQYQLANTNLKLAQLAIYKNHPEVPFNASLNFDFREEAAIWMD